MERAAIYCRSSKDRAEMGLEAQRKELGEYAAQNGLAIVAEFSDMEISGSLDEESRPGLKELMDSLKNPARGWSVLLVLDTSRLARDPMLGSYITVMAEKNGVRIDYSKLPIDGASAFGETIISILRSFDRLHARLSAEKGRSGMVANVDNGYRVGGRAPYGYKLKKHKTGGSRGGVDVEKSTLVLDPVTAPAVKVFLEARADNVSRAEAARRAGIESMAVSSLVGIERNALTYAGYQVWNMRKKHKPTREDPRKTMVWRPRDEWMISDAPMQEALISRAEAEKILLLHDAKPGRQSSRINIRNPEEFILSGLLRTPDGIQYWANATEKTYRAGKNGRRIAAPWLEGEVLRKLADDFGNEEFLTKVINQARTMAADLQSDPVALESEVKKIRRQLDNLLDLAAESGDRSILNKIKEKEAQLERMEGQRAEWVERAALRQKLETIDIKDIRYILALNGLELRDGEGALELLGYEQKDRMSSVELRRIIVALLSKIELDPKTRALTLFYRVPVDTTAEAVNLASPRGFEPRSPP